MVKPECFSLSTLYWNKKNLQSQAKNTEGIQNRGKFLILIFKKVNLQQSQAMVQNEVIQVMIKETHNRK